MSFSLLYLQDAAQMVVYVYTHIHVRNWCVFSTSLPILPVSIKEHLKTVKCSYLFSGLSVGGTAHLQQLGEHPRLQLVKHRHLLSYPGWAAKNSGASRVHQP